MKNRDSKVIVIADSHEAFQKSFRELIENTVQSKDDIIIGVSDKNELLDFISQHVPDIIFIDFYLGQEQTTLIIQDILNQNPEIIIIALSFYDEHEYIDTMLHAGVKGYLLKNADNKEVLEKLLLNQNEKFYFSNEIKLNIQVS